MKCKNCGAELPAHSNICFNCGKNSNDENSLALQAEDKQETQGTEKYKKEKVVSVEHKERRRRRISLVLFTVFTIVVLSASAIGSLMYYNAQNAKKEIPTLTFTSGCGTINKDERIVYASFNDSSTVQYIHGVTLLPNDSEGDAAISENYEYTKSIDDSFRVVFFDIDDLDLKDGEEYNCVFEIKVSFYSDENIYTYKQPVTFDTNARSDISDIVFDHTLNSKADDEDEKEKQTSSKKDAEGTATQSADADFIYNSFWYANPIKDGDNYYVTVYQFRNNGDCQVTQYSKAGDAGWETTSSTVKFEINGNKLTIIDDSANENEVISIDAENQKLISNNEENAELQARKYNSIKNAEDIFGL